MTILAVIKMLTFKFVRIGQSPVLLFTLHSCVFAHVLMNGADIAIFLAKYNKKKASSAFFHCTVESTQFKMYLVLDIVEGM